MTLYGVPRRPRQRGTAIALGFVIVVAVLVVVGIGTAVAVWAVASPSAGAPPAGGAAIEVTGPTSAGTPTRDKPPAAPSRTTSETRPGTFHAAQGSSPRVGGGRVYRYRVEVEDGIDIDPDDFARDVDRILADPRGWTAAGRWGFRRVPGSADFVVKLAVPDTVDRVCGQYGLDTDGEASCRGGANVIINLKRWTQATPAYADDVAMYRHLVINHEVGHFLGFSHAQCPGPGKLAPVMQTQMYGLHGCKRNAWPYP